jgi:hypothetical protein
MMHVILIYSITLVVVFSSFLLLFFLFLLLLSSSSSSSSYSSSSCPSSNSSSSFDGLSPLTSSRSELILKLIQVSYEDISSIVSYQLQPCLNTPKSQLYSWNRAVEPA